MIESFDQAFERVTGSPPPETEGPLRDYWHRPVSELCELLEPARLTEAHKERHRIYAHLLMAVVYRYWNGYKKGRHGKYPWNHKWQQGDPEALEGEYLGHNIAALAVDATGHILDFDFNHNNLFASSAEHAEARLVRRLYSLSRVADSWTRTPSSDLVLGAKPPSGNTSLSEVTIYTSLESCSQCSGVMALAKVKEVVYLQTDPGMYFIGRILRNLTTQDLRAPLPISGGEIGSQFFPRLNHEFSTFKQVVTANPSKPFWIDPEDPDEPDKKPSMTSFLCTAVARGIFAGGGDELDRLFSGSTELAHPDFRPTSEMLTNREVLVESADFRRYAISDGKRGTPHV